MNVTITPRKTTDRGGYYCMPLLANVPAGRAYWKLVRCPECGAKCWKMPHSEYLMEDDKMEKCCGNCGFHRTGKEAGKNSDFYCNNENSEGYGLPTTYEDCCEDWEGRQ